MGKSLRAKREKRLRALRREMVEPLYQKKDEAKLSALQAALAAPKLPVRLPPSTSMDVPTPIANPTSPSSNMDVEMADGEQRRESLKPAGGVGKKMKKKLKLGKRKKGKVRRKHNL